MFYMSARESLGDYEIIVIAQLQTEGSFLLVR